MKSLGSYLLNDSLSGPDGEKLPPARFEQEEMNV
jgi:hypothetical protein